MVLFVYFCSFFSLQCLVVFCQIQWTPIYIDASNQIDLWTQKSKGCTCQWDEHGGVSTRHDCACCVKAGGCHCGQEAPNRCAQCGLEHHCSSMCNLTIDANVLLTKSGKLFGQIKSPQIQGPSSCWYTFRPAPGQRIELQIYRLVEVGKLNGTECVNGYLELVNSGIRICGANERYSPPVILYSDTNTTSTLFFQISKRTLRSQFLAYFSFTYNNNTQVGYRPIGGTLLSDCNWSYRERECMKQGPNGCTLATPGYPGIYPPNKKCVYRVSTDSDLTRVRIKFIAVLMPHNHCSTDFIAIHHHSLNSTAKQTICGNRRVDLDLSGPDVYIVFNSGGQTPPYDYNGFVATLEFFSPSTEATVLISSDQDSLQLSTNSLISVKSHTTISSITSHQSDLNCQILISGNNSRSGHFSTREKEWSPYCKLTFKGSVTDVVHLSLFNYELKSPNCQSFLEIYDGSAAYNEKPMKKFCGPTSKVARDSLGRFIERQTIVSSSNVLTIIVKRSYMTTNTSDLGEYLDGAYLFHDEQIGGTLQPSTMCDVHYYGMSSPSVGTIDNPVDEHVFWNVNGPLKCVQQFIPASNQSITITIRMLGKMKGMGNSHCQTQCGDNGCQCVSDSVPLSQVDHLLLISENQQSLTCMCGDFQAEWLPVVVRSWTAIQVIYFVAQYTWALKGYGFSAIYAFNNDGECGNQVFTSLSGEITQKNLSRNGHFNNYFYQICTWTLDANMKRQLFVEISSGQNRPCNAWNLTIHEQSASQYDNAGAIGERLYTFCPRDRMKTYSFPWKMTAVVIRLSGFTRKQPNFTIKWYSQTTDAHPQFVDPSPASNIISSNGSNTSPLINVFRIFRHIFVIVCALLVLS